MFIPGVRNPESQQSDTRVFIPWIRNPESQQSDTRVFIPGIRNPESQQSDTRVFIPGDTMHPNPPPNLMSLQNVLVDNVKNTSAFV